MVMCIHCYHTLAASSVVTESVLRVWAGRSNQGGMTKPRRFSPLPWHPGPTPTATASGRLISSPTSNATTCHRHPHLLATGIRRIKVPRRPRPKTNSCRLRAPRIRGCGRHSVGMALFAAPATRPVHNWCTRLSYRGQTVWWRWLSVIQRPATQL